MFIPTTDVSKFMDEKLRALRLNGLKVRKLNEYIREFRRAYANDAESSRIEAATGKNTVN